MYFFLLTKPNGVTVDFELTVQTVFLSLFSAALGSLPVLPAGGDAPLLLLVLLLLPQGPHGLVQRSLCPSFGRPLLLLPPGGAAEHAGALALLHVRAHGPGEGEAEARWRLLLVGAAQVHAEDVLGRERKRKGFSSSR